MIASALRYEIESHAARIRAANPLYRSAAAGQAPAAAVERYLASLRYLLAGSSPCLIRAAARARDLGQHHLAEHLRQKEIEERGHDTWAAEDLQVLRARFGTQSDDHPVPAMIELMRHIEEIIDRDPALYLAYILWAEYFTVLVGGELVENLVGRCGVPANAMTCVAKHVELDQDHAAEGVEVIDALIGNPRKLPELREVLWKAMALFDRACEEMMAEPAARAAS